MKIYVMRHGPAEDRAESGIDGDRALTAAGRERVRTVAQALVDAGEEPLHVLTSPLVRAVQTAEIVAIATRLGDKNGTVVAVRDLAPEGDPRKRVARFTVDAHKRVLLVGHEPQLSGLVSQLLGGTLGRPFEKAMVVGLRLPETPAMAALRFVLDPKALRMDPDHRGEP